ncbi:ArsR/SmtB family transcription factor [Kitasatospora gansuensis]
MRTAAWPNSPKSWRPTGRSPSPRTGRGCAPCWRATCSAGPGCSPRAARSGCSTTSTPKWPGTPTRCTSGTATSAAAAARRAGSAPRTVGVRLAPGLLGHQPELAARTALPATRRGHALGAADPSPHALAAVIGRSRAVLLAELDTPASTTDLARRTGITAGGVSQHLTALRAAGLVDAHRSGRYVLYVRTEAAEVLLAAARS